MTPGSVAARLLCLCFIKMSVLKVIYSVIKIKDSRDSPGIPVFKTPSGLPFPSPGDLPDPGVKPKSPALGAWSLKHWTTRRVPRIFNFDHAIDYFQNRHLYEASLYPE